MDEAAKARKAKLEARRAKLKQKRQAAQQQAELEAGWDPSTMVVKKPIKKLEGDVPDEEPVANDNDYNDDDNEEDTDTDTCRVEPKMTAQGKERSKVKMNWELVKAKTKGGLGTRKAEVVGSLGCIVRKGVDISSLKVSFEEKGTALDILHHDPVKPDRVLVTNPLTDVTGWASMKSAEGGVILREMNSLTKGLHDFLKKNKRNNTAINGGVGIGKKGEVDEIGEAIEGLKEMLIAEGVDVEAQLLGGVGDPECSAIAPSGSMTAESGFKSKEKRKTRTRTRNEMLVGWKPSPEKSTKLNCMYRGVPIDVKQKSIIESRPLGSPLRSDDILKANILNDSGLRIKGRDFTSKPSKQARRYLNYIQDAKKRADDSWERKQKEERRQIELKLKQNEVKVFVGVESGDGERPEEEPEIA
ncbi:hypothetical protein TrVE_jg8075 [Triparma verrucosa]|uniref:Uncharacterized protein n=1 Tax=Triparma verrucosa TaxID=1606542 RepID=A0A9W7BKP9_9STRA|nr:hypothetical protein TrVE_jg8075 [Triparma verrucosa]